MADESTASGSEIAAARLLLARLGISPEQLLGTAASPIVVPTFAEYIRRVSSAVSQGTLKVYESYWKRIGDAWGDRRLTELTPLEIRQFIVHTKSHVVVRRNSRGGRLAAEHAISALRCLYRFAEADGLVRGHDNPAKRVAKPRRLASSRHALRDSQLKQINTVAATTGNDPDLDSMIIRLHVETACRRGGALSLRPADLNPEECLIRLREKGETERWQPISPTLMRRLVLHVAERCGNDPYGQLLRYRDHRPITTRRYDYLWKRLGTHLPFVATLLISTHWLRHTTLTWVERTFGYAVARAYAGHNDRRDAGATATYVRADIYEVAFALATLTGEAHPLAQLP